MSFLSRIFGNGRDPRERVRPLWHRVVELAREPRWYADLGVADTLPGRFDMVAMITALVLLRMDKGEDMVRPSVFLTELFVEDMEGQLRESGVGDQVVGKHMGKLMSVLGGRIGALRSALTESDDTALQDFATRNMTMLPDAPTAPLAAAIRAFAASLDALPDEDVLDGKLPA